MRRSCRPPPGNDIDDDLVVGIKVPERWAMCEDLENVQPREADMAAVPTS